MGKVSPGEELELLFKAFSHCLEGGRPAGVRTCKGTVVFRRRKKVVEVEINEPGGICYEIWG